MDYCNKKFGRPFTEVEVEDVKTVLRLLPLIICLSRSLSVNSMLISTANRYTDTLLSCELRDWLIPLLLIPFYHLYYVGVFVVLV